jgi:hypothetical protein
MKKIDITSLGSLPTFTRTEATSDVYWTERANWTFENAAKDAADEGFTISQVETADVDLVATWLSDIHASLNTFINSFITYLFEGGSYPEEPTLPALPSNYDFFHKIILQNTSLFYEVLRQLRSKQVEKLVGDMIRDGQNEIAESEGIINIGDHMVWMKSVSVDEI